MGDILTQPQSEALAAVLTQALEMAAGLREKTSLLEQLTTKEMRGGVQGVSEADTREAVLSFSGGVADCIGTRFPWNRFGDIGPGLGTAIRESRLCRGAFVLGKETIRATVIGAGCHSTQLSGSTVFHRNVTFPLKNLPVVSEISALAALDGPGVVALKGISSPSYAQVQALAERIAEGVKPPVYIALEADMAKALGHALILRLGAEAQVLCLDRVELAEGDYLDVGEPVGPALPVVIKSLIFGGNP
jgi:ethanolamine utilization protein EutA